MPTPFPQNTHIMDETSREEFVVVSNDYGNACSTLMRLSYSDHLNSDLNDQVTVGWEELDEYQPVTTDMWEHRRYNLWKDWSTGVIPTYAYTQALFAFDAVA